MQIDVNFHFTLLFMNCFLFSLDRFSQSLEVHLFTVSYLNRLFTKMLDMCSILRRLFVCSMRLHCYVGVQSSIAYHLQLARARVS
jgi:hypothetical protein